MKDSTTRRAWRVPLVVTLVTLVAVGVSAASAGATATTTQAGVHQEGPPSDPSCSDGVDNDGDGRVDGQDPDCNEPLPECFDGIDNDGDGGIDFPGFTGHPDLDCDSPEDSETPECSDHVDNDGDGKTDFSRNRFHRDPDCTSPGDDSEATHPR